MSLDVVAGDRAGGARSGAGLGHPQVAVAIDRGAVRKQKHLLAEAGEQLALRVVFEDRSLAAPGARVLEAAVDDVDRPVRGSLDRGDRSPRRAPRQLAPVAPRLVRLRQIVA